MKAIWKGTISFGLVTIPIQLFSAIQEHVIGFKLLHSVCHTPIEYQRWCPHCQKKVAWNDVEKGLEVRKGEYIILTQEKIKALKPETTNSIDIIEFVDSKLIAPIYYNNHYYIAPTDVKKAKAFELFKQVLGKSGKAAVGKFVMREKEYVCSLQSYDRGILLSTLNYSYEIRSMEKIPTLEIKKEKFTAGELRLAHELIAQLTEKKFDISHFKDTFAEQILKILKSRKKGKKIAMPKKKAVKAHVRKAPSLEDMLKESLHEARA